MALETGTAARSLLIARERGRACTLTPMTTRSRSLPMVTSGCLRRPRPRIGPTGPSSTRRSTISPIRSPTATCFERQACSRSSSSGRPSTISPHPKCGRSTSSRRSTPRRPFALRRPTARGRRSTGWRVWHRAPTPSRLSTLGGGRSSTRRMAPFRSTRLGSVRARVPARWRSLGARFK